MLADKKLAILAFEPRDKAQYGMLEVAEGRVLRIVEWKYWHTYSPEQRARLSSATPEYMPHSDQSCSITWTVLPISLTMFASNGATNG